MLLLPLHEHLKASYSSILAGTVRVIEQDDFLAVSLEKVELSLGKGCSE